MKKTIVCIFTILFILSCGGIFAAAKKDSEKIILKSVGVPLQISDEKKAWGAYNHFRTASREEAQKVLDIALAGVDENTEPNSISVQNLNNILDKTDFEKYYLYILLSPCKRNGIYIADAPYYIKGSDKLIHPVKYEKREGDWGYLRLYLISKDNDSLGKVVYEDGKYVATALFEDGVDINEATPSSLYKHEKGFVYIVNSDFTNFAAFVNGDKCFLPDSKEEAAKYLFIFTIDTTAFQITFPPYNQFYTAGSKEGADKAILTAYMQWEQKFYEELLIGKKINVEHSFSRTKGGKTRLTWSFVIPEGAKRSNTAGNTMIFCCKTAGKSVLSVNGTVIKGSGPEFVKNKVIEIIDDAYISAKPITHKMGRELIKLKKI